MNNDYVSAKNYLVRQIQENPADKTLHFYLGKTLLTLKEYQQAKLEFDLALKNGYQKNVLKYLGQIYEDQGMLAEAIEKYQLAIRMEPESTVLKMKLASLFYKQQNYPATISILENFIRQETANLQVYYLLGRSYIRQELYDSTLSVASKAIYQDSTHVPNLLNFGIACFEKNKLDSSANILEKTLQFSPKSDEAKYYLAKTYAKTKRLPEAIEQLEDCYKLNGRYRLKAMKSLVQFYHKADSLAGCVRLSELYLHEKPEEPFVHHYFGRALSDLQRYDQAKEELNKAILFSNQEFLLMTYFYQGLNYYYQMDYPNAIKWYKKVLSIDVNFGYAYYNLAVAYDMYYEDKSTAIHYYQKVLDVAEKVDLDPASVIAAQTRLKELRERAFFETK